MKAKTSALKTLVARRVALLLITGLLPVTTPAADGHSASTTLGYNEGRPYLTEIAAMPGTSALIPYYDEAGFLSKPLGPVQTQPPFGFAITGPGLAHRPQNGTAYIQLLLGSSYEVFGQSGEVFDAMSIDLAEYSTVFPVPREIGMQGTRVDGSIVSTSFTIDGVIGIPFRSDFQTFSFPESFRGLVNLRATTDLFSLDNLTLRLRTDPPVIIEASAGLDVIWPPDNRMVTVELNAVVAGNANDTEWSVVAIECNEPCPDTDMRQLNDHKVSLRAARLGSGRGRIYTIWLQAIDVQGNLSELFPVSVSVPHDLRRNRP